MAMTRALMAGATETAAPPKEPVAGATITVSLALMLMGVIYLLVFVRIRVDH